MATSEPQPHASHRPPLQQSIQPTHSTIHFITQDDCFKHVFRRSKDASTIFERPERLRFVNLGLAAAVAWDWLHGHNTPAPPRLLVPSGIVQPEASPSCQGPQQQPLSSLIQSSQITFSKCNRKIYRHDPTFEQVHDQPNRSTTPISPSASGSAALATKDPSASSNTTAKFADVQESTNYLDQLIGLCRRASELHHLGLSEVPEHLPQGDLYLSLGSEAAILGAIGTCYTAIDSIFQVEDSKPKPVSPSASTQNEIQSSQYKKAFVNIRPPGHHCTNSEPMGFCWVNNVLIGCMYSYLTYGIDRICIVDIDLHHGNGSQEIVWKLNTQAGSVWSENSDRREPNTQNTISNSSQRRPLKISYSSLHDINSYPCEDGDPDRIKEASLNICVGNAINQFIQNLHIEDWSDEEDFYKRLYPKTWTAFEQHMQNFFQITDARPDRSLIFVSAGFDACEYETGQMSRFAKKLPASFFNRFARDISRFSDSNCNGRLISVLEGGYSEQTLVGSSLSYMLGLMDSSRNQTCSQDDFPWSLGRVNQLLKLCKKGDSNRKSNPVNKTTMPPESLETNHSKDLNWIAETRRLFEHIDSWDEVKSELNKFNRQEEKQIKLQQSMSQLALESHSPEGLRRSQRHASSTTKSDSSPSNMTQKPTLQTSANNGQRTRSPQPSSSSSTTSAPLDKSSQLSSSPEITTTSENNQLNKHTTEQRKQSIDELLGNLKIVEGHEYAEQKNDGPAEDPKSINQPTTTENFKLPKVKLVWKAGGVFGS